MKTDEQATEAIDRVSGLLRSHKAYPRHTEVMESVRRYNGRHSATVVKVREAIRQLNDRFSTPEFLTTLRQFDTNPHAAKLSEALNHVDRGRVQHTQTFRRLISADLRVKAALRDTLARHRHRVTLNPPAHRLNRITEDNHAT